MIDVHLKYINLKKSHFLKKSYIRVLIYDMFHLRNTGKKNVLNLTGFFDMRTDNNTHIMRTRQW